MAKADVLVCGHTYLPYQGLDHIGFAVESKQQLEDLLVVLRELNVSTAGIEFDPDGEGEYVCFRDPDNIQIEFYVGDYED